MLREIDVLLDDSTIDEITGKILGAAIEVHRVLGPGPLESVYCVGLRYELAARGLRFTIQEHIPITYKEVALAASHRVDLIVEDLIVVEGKAVAALVPVNLAQALT